jgi:hypothetical protein
MIVMSHKETILNSIEFDSGWHRIRLKFVTDDVNYSIYLSWHESESRWLVMLTEDVVNDSGEEIYESLEDSETFATYQDARDYVVELTEEYP